MIYRLENTVQKYAWGSRTFISDLLGRAIPSGKPEAELWMGSHPRAPSRARDRGDSVPLDKLIRRDPAGMLGERAATKFQGRLPFLLKVLAADSPLSIQAHPDREQARAGFLKEHRAGIPVNGPQRNYQDSNHKPELLCALTPFDALCGFRPLPEIADLLSFLHLADAIPEAETFRRSPTEEGLRSLFKTLFSLRGRKKEHLLETLVERAATNPPRSEDETLTLRWIARLAGRYPGDIGICAPVLLNTIRLHPGKALYLNAGVLHSYLEGAGIEIMANSDNVLRGGLTAKHVDRTELLKILSFSGKPVSVLHGQSADGIEFVYRTPAEEFRLSRMSLSVGFPFRAAHRNGPEIILCGGGSCRITGDAGEKLKVEKGESVFIPFNAGGYRIEGESTLYRASLPGDE